MGQKVVCPFGYGPRIRFLWTPHPPVAVSQLYSFELGRGGEKVKKGERKIWFPVAVTLVMVLGSFVVMAPAPGTMTQVGDRGGDSGVRDAPPGAAVSLFDLIMNEQESNLQDTAITDSGIEVAMPEGMPEAVALPAQTISEDEHVEVVDVKPREGGTRSPGVDANGPYGGPDTYEGATITFTCTADDPTLVFFRWDLNDDGEWDTEWRLSFTMSDTINWVYDDDFYGDIVCEAWDGVSTQTIIITGKGLTSGPFTTYWTTYGWRKFGWKFKPFEDLTVNRLGAYMHSTYSTPYYMTLFDVATQGWLRTCNLPFVNLQWNWCSVTPIDLTAGKEYLVLSVWYAPSSSPYGGMMTNSAVFHDLVEGEISMYYEYTSNRYTYPPYGPAFSGSYTPMVDFEFYFKKTTLITFSDNAQVTVNNIAPEAFGFQVNPPIGREGEPVEFYGQMSDAGLADTWKARVHFGDGNVSDWLTVPKWDYIGLANAKVLFATTWSYGADVIVANNFANACGVYCTQVDTYDWYQAGTPPDLAYMLEYDVVFVGTNYIPTAALANAMGDRLADFADAGGAVVQHWSSMHTSPRIHGRWLAEGYNAIQYGGLHTGYYNMGTIHEPGHELLAGVTNINGFYRHNSNDVTEGAVRVVDWDNGMVLAAWKSSPVSGSKVVGLNYYPVSSITGDYYRMMVNAAKFVGQTKVPKQQPLEFGPIEYVYMDDNPTTTPYDTYDVTIEVWDDDHGRLIISSQNTLYTQDFQSSCSGNTWPAGWSANPLYWECYYSSYLSSNAAQNWWTFYGGWGNLQYDVSFDMSAYAFVNFGFRHDLDMTWGGGETHALVQGSIDGGASYPYSVAEWHHESGGPTGSDSGTKLFSAPWAAGESDVRFRFRVYNYDDFWWHVDNIFVEGLEGMFVEGSASVQGQIIIENVEPGNQGGHPSSDYVDEMDVVYFQDYAITDPALWIDTEWFAYKWDMDDGYEQPWIYRGSMATPKDAIKVLLVHSYCSDTQPNCETGHVADLRTLIEADESVAYVDLWDIFNRVQAPSISTMLQYDIIMYGVNWGWNPAFEPRWPTVREDLGDRLADYLDMGAGGVVTMMGALNNYEPYVGWGPIWQILGRYTGDGYAPYEPSPLYGGGSSLGEIFVPGHMMMRDIESGSVTNTLLGGDHDVTIGGQNNAEGVDGLNVADWANGRPAVGAKELLNGARTGHLNGYGGYWSGPMATQLFGNALLWAWGKAPSPVIADFAYSYGDNGVYTVDLMMVDDDMGWIWDGTDLVAAPGHTQTVSHSYSTIAVNNVDPTISALGAYMDIEPCIRMTGNKGNMATLTISGSDGTYETVTAVRVPGNPVVACLPQMRIDVSVGTTYDVTIEYDPADDDGANPTWIFSGTFPNGKVKEMRKTFQSDLGFQIWSIPNKEFKRMGIGQEISFEATASDPGSDDLAFIWIWGDRTPYTICIYEHPGIIASCAESDVLEELPFPEPDFTVSSNNMRSPEVDPIRAFDAQTHVFGEQYFYYVTLIVADDDVKDPYPSTYLTPGIDMEVIELDW